MASLADQLRANASGSEQRLAQAKHNFRPSYLYAPKQAASLSLDDIFGLGQNGYTALVQVTPALRRLQPVLFEEPAKQTDRALLTKEEAAKLDQHLNHCIALLGPSVLIRPCGQILEWLIRRFRVQEENVNALMSMILPYHETPQFAQLLQLMPIDKHPVFHPFLAVKKTLQPMPRHTLIKAMSRNSDLLQFVINTLLVGLKHESAHPGLIGFWAATLVAYLDLRPSVTQQELSLLLPALFTAIKLRAKADVQLAAHVIMANLTAKSLLTADAVETIVNLVAVKRCSVPRDQPTVDDASLKTIIAICQTQEELEVFPLRAWEALIVRPTFWSTVSSLHQSHEMTLFWRPFAKTTAQQLQAASATEAQAATDRLLQLEPCPAQIITDSFFASLTADGKVAAKSAALASNLSRLRQRFPLAFSAAVEASASSQPDATAKAVELVIAAERKESLSQGARDADDSVRLLAYQQLLSSTEDVSQSDALDILKDPSASVSALLAAHAPKLLAALDSSEIAVACKDMIASESTPRPVLAHHVSFLCQSFLKAKPTAAPLVIEALWPRLLFSKGGKKITDMVYEQLSSSPLAQNELKTCFAAQNKKQDLPSRNQHIVEALARLCADNETLLKLLNKQLEDKEPPVMSLLVANLVLSRTSRNTDLHSTLAQHYHAMLSGLDQLDTKGELLDAQGAPLLSVWQAATFKPKSPKTRARLIACLLTKVSRCYHVDTGAAWSWLDAGAANNDFKLVARGTFLLAHSTEHPQLRSSLFTSLFGHLLSQDALAFLASLWIDPSQLQSGGGAMALLDAAAIISSPTSKKYDFQLLLPTLSVPLSSADRQVREAALRVLQALSDAGKLSDGSVYGRKTFFGARTGHIATLTSKDAISYMTAVLDQHTAVTLSGDAFVATHTSLGEKVAELKKPKKLQQAVAAFLASVVPLAPSSLFLSVTLGAATAIKISDSVSLFIPVMRLVQRGVLSIDLQEQDNCTLKLIKTYEATKSAAYEQPTSEPLAFLRQLIQSAPASSASSRLRQGALNILKTSLYRKLSLASRLSMINFLIDQALSPDTPVDVAETLAQMKIDPDTLTGVLDKLLAEADPSGASAKRTKTATQSNGSTGLEPQQRLTLLLERLSFTDLEINSPLFQALYELATLYAGEQTLVSSSLAFIKQQLVAALSQCLIKLSRQDKASLSTLRIAPLMDMLRTSPNPQATQRVLALVAQFTEIIPEQVVQNIIPLFTFMGTSVSQRDDAFAQKTLALVINCTLPVLVSQTKANAKTHTQLVSELRDVLRTMTNLASHIPRYRRASLFAQFVSALGPQDFLSPVTLMLLLPVASSDKSVKVDLAERYSTAAGLVDAFTPRDQISAMCQLATEAHKLVSASYSKESAQQAGIIITFLLQLLQDRRFVSRIDAARSQDQTTFDQGLQSIIKSVTLLAGNLSGDLEAVANDVVRQAARLMATQSLSDVVVWLLGQKSHAGTLGGLALLRQALSSIKGSKNEQRRNRLAPALEATVQRLVQLVNSAATTEGADLEEATKTVKLMTRMSAPAEQDSLNSLVVVALQQLQSPSLSTVKHEILMDVLPALIRCLGPRLLPQAQQLAALARSSCLLSSSDRLQSAGLETLQAMLQALSNFVAPFLSDFVSVSLHSGAADLPRLQAFRSSLARQVPFKTVCQACSAAWETASTSSTQIQSLLQLVKMSLDAATSAEVLKEHKPLFPLLLQAWEWRSEAASAVHTAATATFMSLVLKLNEAAFKPLLLRAVDWAFVDQIEGPVASLRKEQMLSLMRTLLQQLKIVALPYFAYLLDSVCALLEGFSAKDMLIQEDRELWTITLATLRVALGIDREGFWNEARLRKMIQPLAGQVQLAREPRHVLKEHYWPVLCSFAEQAADSGDVLQDVNRTLLEFTRSDQEEGVRVQALRSLANLWRRTRDPLVPLVPQTTPFIVEALEERGEVEVAAREMVAAVEECLGEGTLADYMT